MRTSIYVTGCGNVGFTATFLATYHKTVDIRSRSPYYVKDMTSGCDFGPWRHLFSDQFYEIDHTDHGGCNALWNQAVDHARHLGAHICIVCNDDIMFPTPGWLEAIEYIFEKNEHVAMVGIASDGEWDEQHKVKERWFTDPSLLLESALHCQDFREKPVRYTHHVSGPLWACRPNLWLKVGGIPKELFWGYGEVVPSIELRKLGYHSVACQFPTTILHYCGGTYLDIHADPDRHASFDKRMQEFGDDAKFFADRYGTHHLQILSAEFDKELETMNLPELKWMQPQ